LDLLSGTEGAIRTSAVALVLPCRTGRLAARAASPRRSSGAGPSWSRPLASQGLELAFAPG